MGLFDRLRHKEVSSPAAIDTDAVVDSILNPSSFSLLVFSGDHAESMHDFLSSCAYVPLRARRARGTPVSLHDALAGPRGPNNSIVMKALRSMPEITMLVDPEMVLSAGSEQKVAAFCAQHGTDAIGVLWERVSESAILTEVTGEGVKRRTWYERGQPLGAQLDPRPEVERSPDADGLRMALAACGLPVDELFAEADVTVLELRE